MIYLALASLAAVIALVALLFILGSRVAAESHQDPDGNASENDEPSRGEAGRIKS